MRRLIKALRVLIFLTVFLIVVAFVAVSFTLGGSQQWHQPTDYGALRSSVRAELVAHFPASIPLHATGVRIFCPSGGFPPTPDRTLELRILLPPADTVAVAKDMTSRPLAIIDPESKSSLQSIDDMKPSTPLPAGFQRIVLFRSATGDSAGVTINVTTGEIVYWCFDL
jgi:hypothetical protein